jgi:hypothetical protein
VGGGGFKPPKPPCGLATDLNVQNFSRVTVLDPQTKRAGEGIPFCYPRIITLFLQVFGLGQKSDGRQMPELDMDL